jgi:hypothetical protein
VSSDPAFFRIVSFPDEAASTVCRSIERLIFALRSYTNPRVKPGLEELVFTLKRERRGEGGWKGEERSNSKRIVQVSTFFKEAIFIA